MKVNIYKECKEKIKTKDKISVIVPNYNYERFLKERIDSILLQTVPIYELIFLDDASSDESVSYLNKKIEERIDYSFFNLNLRHEILTSANISVCLYCNRQYILYYFDNHDNKKTTADLDHFYPKSLFPLFSLSLYNFISSCQICNQRMKKIK